MKAASSPNASISSTNHEFCNQEREVLRKAKKPNAALFLKPTLPRICQCIKGKGNFIHPTAALKIPESSF